MPSSRQSSYCPTITSIMLLLSVDVPKKKDETSPSKCASSWQFYVALLLQNIFVRADKDVFTSHQHIQPHVHCFPYKTTCSQNLHLSRHYTSEQGWTQKDQPRNFPFTTIIQLVIWRAIQLIKVASLWMCGPRKYPYHCLQKFRGRGGS